MSVFSTRSVLAGLALVLAGSSSALAVDGQAFADRLKTVMAGQSVNLTFASVATEGEDVVLRDAKVTSNRPGPAPAADPVGLGDVRFETVTGSTPEGWRASRVALDDVDQSEDGVRVTLTGASVDGLEMKGTNDTTATLAPLFFDRAVVDGVGIEKAGKSVVAVENVRLQNAQTSGGGYRSTFDVGKFNVDTTASGEAQGSAMLAELGYPQVSGDLSGTAAWDPQTGMLQLDPLQLEVDNAGELAFSYTITGYTPSFIQSLAQLSQQMQASGGNADGSGMAIIGLISQLYLKSAELSFEDRSLTNRLLDYFAKQNGQSRDQLVSSLTGMMPMALTYLQNPDFQTKVAGALTNFLQNPQSLRIAIAPPAPVPATQIIGAAMGAPQTLPQVLNVDVRSGN
ncbi:hypothetical protein [Aureimonas sp. AU12]|uniref:hypothetical protein n=1 Tax=Aureimonas sp. AU12 TaxID=1638161 RepID=UPI00078449FD|nr:hypothetical protein [Aureimonas sp. AU12]